MITTCTSMFRKWKPALSWYAKTKALVTVLSHCVGFSLTHVLGIGPHLYKHVGEITNQLTSRMQALGPGHPWHWCSSDWQFFGCVGLLWPTWSPKINCSPYPVQRHPGPKRANIQKKNQWQPLRAPKHPGPKRVNIKKKINCSLLRAPKMPWAQDHHPPHKIDTCSFIVVILTLVPLTLYPSPYTFILTLIPLPLPLYLTPYP